ncbi:hypothetical protein [Motilibacter deserti]|uniref:Secreted protein n=1 Tax=Motilibacter deserti TaxID=2714956 RepID=A0ABX0GSW1_9ACTN|nr:hypothetical protein [Motilibacter deserti]NHC12782.1 hypothetical protein [Motilibacter deserti]
MTTRAESTTGISRREALKKGALVGGAAVWAVPAMQAISVGTADAASAGPTPPVPTVPADPPKPCIPATGLLLCTVWKWGRPCLLGVKIDEHGVIDCIPTAKGDRDADFLRSLGYATWSKPSDLGMSVSGGFLSGKTGLYLLLPTLASFVKAWVSDINLCTPSGGSGHEEAHCSGGKVIFTRYA